jgi:site-specific recombinase
VNVATTDYEKMFAETVERMVQERTLSLEAVKGLDELRVRMKQAQVTIEQLEEKLASKGEVVNARNAEITRLKGDIERLEKEVTVWETREADIKRREGLVFQHEKQSAVSAAEAGAYKYALETVFRPSIMRETVQRNSNRSENSCQGNNYSPAGSYDNETVIRETREE